MKERGGCKINKIQGRRGEERAEMKGREGFKGNDMEGRRRRIRNERMSFNKNKIQGGEGKLKIKN